MSEVPDQEHSDQVCSEERLAPGLVASLYLEHADELRSFLTGVLRSPDLAADALQATFARAMESGHTAREETRKGWLFRVAFNEAMQLKRRGGIHDRSLRRLAAEGSANTNDEHERPTENLIRFEIVERVRRALDQLPENQREVVRRRIYDEQTFAVIAEELGLPLGTVLTRMRLALQKLAGRLQDPLESRPHDSRPHDS